MTGVHQVEEGAVRQNVLEKGTRTQLWLDTVRLEHRVYKYLQSQARESIVGLIRNH